MISKLKSYIVHTGAGYWAFLYLLCIPLFATIYTIPVFDFRHSTLSQEKSVLARKDEIDDLVFEKVSLSGYGSIGGEEHFNFELISSAYDNLGLTYLLSYAETDAEGNRTPVGVYSNDVPKIGFLYCVIPLFLTRTIEYRTYSLNCMETDLGSHIMNMPTINSMRQVTYEEKTNDDGMLLGLGMLISINSSDLLLKQLINEFEYGIAGSTESFEWTERFSRMFYFSAVTITTLGYGDITPINNYARSAVALHSILGIVFMGLFLNGLARTKM